MDASLMASLKELKAEIVSEAFETPQSNNEIWSMGFMNSSLKDGINIRTFILINDYNREILGIEVDFSLASPRVF